jgi:DNA-binding NarL/FixJ family response regulator
MVFHTDADNVPTVDPAAVRRAELLTPRQRDVLLALSEGLSSSRVAERLGIRESTVRGHIKSLLQKLQVHTQLQAVLVGIRAGVVPLDVTPS